MWLKFLCTKTILVINSCAVCEWICTGFSNALTKRSAWNSVLETATESPAVWLAAAFGKLNYSLGCRERQAYNGHVCSLVFAPAVLFNVGKIWAAGGIGFVTHGYEVCALDGIISPSKLLSQKSSHRSSGRVVGPALQYTWQTNFSRSLTWVGSSPLANWFWIRPSPSSLKQSIARWSLSSVM